MDSNSKQKIEEQPRTTLNKGKQSTTILITYNMVKHNNNYILHMMNYLYDELQKGKLNEEWNNTFERLCDNNRIKIKDTIEKYIPITYSKNGSNTLSHFKFWILLIEYYKNIEQNSFEIIDIITVSNYALSQVQPAMINDFISCFNIFCKTKIQKKSMILYLLHNHKNINPNKVTDYSFLLHYRKINTKATSLRKKPFSKYERKNKENNLNKPTEHTNKNIVKPLCKKMNNSASSPLISKRQNKSYNISVIKKRPLIPKMSHSRNDTPIQQRKNK